MASRRCFRVAGQSTTTREASSPDRNSSVTNRWLVSTLTNDAIQVVAIGIEVRPSLVALRNREDHHYTVRRRKKRVVTGSYLEIIYPEYAVWEEGVTSYIYPFIFSSDSTWDVDVCSEVPAGYKVVGVYDESGNLVADTRCARTIVAGVMNVLAFEVVDLSHQSRTSRGNSSCSTRARSTS